MSTNYSKLLHILKFSELIFTVFYEKAVLYLSSKSS